MFSKSNRLFSRTLFNKCKRSLMVSKSILDMVPQSKNTESLWPQLREAVSINPRRLIVLDDDPTGCQTVYDINVLLDYSKESIIQQLLLDDKLFYILTNTRSLSEGDAVKVTKQVVENVRNAVEEVGYSHQIQYISRSDSTLRGHHPAEVKAIAESLRVPFDKVVLMPAFFEGGRLTFQDVHYVQEGDNLIPAGETPFAKDAHFGFSASNLRDWVVEKEKGLVSSTNVLSISLKDIREGGIETIANILESQALGDTIVVNAVHQHDMNMFMLGLLKAEADGLNCIYRTAASFVSSRAGLEPKGLLTTAQLFNGQSPSAQKLGGLIVVGSYVPKSTSQLSSLIEGSDILPLELSVSSIIEAVKIDSLSNNTNKTASISTIVSKAVHTINNAIFAGRDVVLYTTRDFQTGSTLADAASVSNTITEIVRCIEKPAFLVAKGGITSHDVAFKSLNIKTAQVIGQIEPGVPVWKAGIGSRFPGMNYVVFPGNVGDNDALLRVAITLGVAKKSSKISKIEIDLSVAPVFSFDNSSRPPDLGGMVANSKLLSALMTAQSQGYAIAAFNVYNLEGAKAAVLAAELSNSPVILQLHPSSFRFGGKQLLDLLCSFRAHASVPVFVHIDHADTGDEKAVLDMLDYKCNIDSVMIDGSAMSLEDNIQWTAKMAGYAHEAGAVVEAELGRLTGEEDGMSVDAKEAKMTDPASVAMFIKETKVDLLAVTIGNVHGTYSQPPQLDFLRLEAIRRNVPTGFPLVLHGASGLSRDFVMGAIARGVCKFNVNTDLRHAAMKTVRETMMSKQKTDVLQLMEATTTAMQGVAHEKIALFRSGINVKKN